MPKVSDEHVQSRRLQILQAALSCFGKHGVQGTSMQDIFAESGLSAGAVYSYFDSKRAIIKATVELSVEQVAASFSQLAELPAVQALDGFTRHSFAHLADPEARPMLCAMLSFLAEAARDDELRALYQTMAQSVREVLERAFSALEAQGFGRGIDPAQAARVCYALYEGCLAQKALDPGLDVDAFVDTMFALMSFSPDLTAGPR